MDQIVRLNAGQEAVLQATAENFVALHRGDAMKALKEMIVLNTHLQKQVEAMTGELKYPRQGMRRLGGQSAP